MFVMVMMLCLGAAARAQYTDYVGAGQDDGIVATASSEDMDSPTEGASAQDTVSGSGLEGDTHSTAWEDTWTSYDTAASPNPARGVGTWIHYDLGHVYGLGLMHVWNGNEVTARGPSSVTIDYSVDGTNWTELGTFDDWPEAPESDDYTGFDGPDFAGVSARYILITVNSTHGSGEDWTAISEIKIEVGAAGAPITVDSNDIPVYEPQDTGGPPPAGPTDGQLLVSLAWRPGEDPCYPNDPCYYAPVFTCTVTVDPNEGDSPHEDFIFPDSIAADGSVTLTFDQTDWNIPKNVVVQAVKDIDREGNESYPVELTFTIDIADPNFISDPCEPVTTSVGVVDNDIPSVVALPPAIEGQLSENEPFVPYCFDVTLSHKPTDDVYVIVVRESEYEIVLESMSVMDPNFEDWTDPNRMTFTPDNYNDNQTICLKALDDDIRGEGPEEEGLEWVPGVVILTPYSEDPRYSVDWLQPDPYGFPIDLGEGGNPDGEAGETFVDFDVQDNECGAWSFNRMDFNENCRVGLADFVEFLAQWTACTQPYEDDCDSLWNLFEEE